MITNSGRIRITSKRFIERHGPTGKFSHKRLYLGHFNGWNQLVVEIDRSILKTVLASD